MPKMKPFLYTLILAAASFGNLAGAQAADRDYREQQLKFARSYDAADYKAALEAAEKLHEMRPKEIAHIYNVACMNCLLGNSDAAYRWLDKLVDAGFKDADGLLNDYDFRTLRAEPRFRALLRRIRGEKVNDDRPAAEKKESKKEAKKDSDDVWDGPEKRKIEKLDSKDETASARLSQSEMQRLSREIGELTQELIATAPNDSKKALKIAEKAYQNARKIEASLKSIAPEAVAQIRPGVSLTAYNVACMQSLLGNKDVAFEHLEIARKYGGLQGRMLEQMSGDGDLENLRKDKRYAAIVTKLGGKVAQEEASDAQASTRGGKFEEELPDVEEMSPRDRFNKIGGLTQELITAATSGDHDKALDIALRAVAHSKILYDLAKDNEQYGPQIRTQWTLTNYNAACMYSLSKNKDAALFYLDRSVGDAKYFPGDFIEQIKRDSDLDFLRGSEAFKRIFNRAKKAAAGDGDGASETASTFKEELPEVDKDLSLEQRSARVNQLIQKAYQASQNKNTDQGFEFAREAVAHVQLVYDDVKDDGNIGNQARGLAALTDYNLACFYSLKNNKEGALFYLRRAAENRDYFPSDFANQLRTDSDMDNIRDTAGFKAILGSQDKPEPVADSSGEDETAKFEWKVTLPPHYDDSKAAPLIVALHHYHGNMDRTTERWQKAAAELGAILLAPQGTVKLGDGMYHWGRDLDLVERNVMMSINKVMDEHKIDQKHIVLGGFSQGGWATWGIALRNPEAFCGIIPVCGSVRVESDNAFKRDGLDKMRVWVMLGEDENSSVIESNEDAAAKLRDRGSKVKVNTYEGVGHGYPSDRDGELTKALKFVMDR